MGGVNILVSENVARGDQNLCHCTKGVGWRGFKKYGILVVPEEIHGLDLMS